MAKIAKQEGLTWTEALAVLESGGYVDHEHWNGALRLRRRVDGGEPVFWVTADPTLPKAEQFNGHQWKRTQAEVESLEWREVEFVEFADDIEAMPTPGVAEADLDPDPAPEAAND